MAEQEVLEVGEENLAWQVRNAFQRLISKTNPDKRPMFQVWRDAFEIGDNDTALFDALRLISAALDRLKEQVENCAVMDRTSKDIYLNAIRGFRTCVDPRQLHHPYHQMQGRFTSDQVAVLTLMGDRLREWFPEAKLSAGDLETLTEAIEELSTLLDQVGIQEYVRSILRGHINIMKWSIENYSLFGMEAAYDTIVRARIEFHRFEPEIQKVSEGDKKYSRITDIFQRISKTVDFADRAGRTGERVVQITHKAGELLNFLS